MEAKAWFSTVRPSVVKPYAYYYHDENVLLEDMTHKQTLARRRTY